MQVTGRETISRDGEIPGILNFSSFKNDTHWVFSLLLFGFGLNINNVFVAKSLKDPGKQ